MADETKYPDTFREWMEDQFGEDFHDTCKDIAAHGCVNGFPGLTYYKDTVVLHDEYEGEIWNALAEAGDEQGTNTLELIASFNGSDNVGSSDQFKNLLVWWMAEKIAYCVSEGE